MKSATFKLVVLILFVFNYAGAIAQELPINPSTGLVVIKDSVMLSGASKNDFFKACSNWNQLIQQTDTLIRLFKLDAKEENITAGMILNSGDPERRRNEFIGHGNIIYNKIKRSPFTGQPIGSSTKNGTVEYKIYYTITSTQVTYEITEFIFHAASDYSLFGRFEDDKPSKSWSVGILSNNKKTWSEVKQDYFQRVLILSQNLKLYLQNYLDRP